SHVGGVDRVEPLPPDRHDPDRPEPLDPVPRLSLGFAIPHQERSRLEPSSAEPAGPRLRTPAQWGTGQGEADVPHGPVRVGWALPTIRSYDPAGSARPTTTAGRTELRALSAGLLAPQLDQKSDPSG